MPAFRYSLAVLLLLSVVTALLYAGGLNGPFLFDDHVHITQNRWVKIESLGWSELAQAYGSSFSGFPANRPLAQLSFGVNHAISGLDAWAFKTTNLAIHLATGLFVFLLVNLGLRALGKEHIGRTDARIVALTVAAFWLMHPLHVSTVLYTVQRMAQISTISLLAALSCYYWGRIQIANGKPGAVWILMAAPIAILGFLGKENTVLLPLLLLVSELTVLRRLSAGRNQVFIRSIWVLFIAVPLLAGLTHMAMEPHYFDYSRRPFTLEERLLTQARVLWLYVQWIFVPDLSALGLLHDDVTVSRSIWDPPTTGIAVLGLFAAVAGALAFRGRWPVVSFGVLFFLAAHALESGLFPLELVFEHRNYLASVGPLTVLAWFIIVGSRNLTRRRVVLVLAGLLLLAYATATSQRVDNWSSYERFVFSTAANHPGSPRANFLAAQLLISTLGTGEPDEAMRTESATRYLDQCLEADPEAINCLFGQVVLDLHVDRYPDPGTLERLMDCLRDGHVDATKVSISQFSYLVRWQRADGLKLRPADIEALFDAALKNPGWNSTGRGGIEAAYREYHEFVTGDLERALLHATRAIAAWPKQWSYHLQRVDVLIKMAQYDMALDGLAAAAPLTVNEKQHTRMTETLSRIQALLQ